MRAVDAKKKNDDNDAAYKKVLPLVSLSTSLCVRTLGHRSLSYFFLEPLIANTPVVTVVAPRQSFNQCVCVCVRTIGHRSNSPSPLVPPPTSKLPMFSSQSTVLS